MIDERRRHEVGTCFLGEVARLLEEAREKLKHGELSGDRRIFTEVFVKRAEALLRSSRLVQ